MNHRKRVFVLSWFGDNHGIPERQRSYRTQVLFLCKSLYRI